MEGRTELPGGGEDGAPFDDVGDRAELPGDGDDAPLLDEVEGRIKLPGGVGGTALLMDMGDAVEPTESRVEVERVVWSGGDADRAGEDDWGTTRLLFGKGVVRSDVLPLLVLELPGGTGETFGVEGVVAGVWIDCSGVLDCAPLIAEPETLLGDEAVGETGVWLLTGGSDAGGTPVFRLDSVSIDCPELLTIGRVGDGGTKLVSLVVCCSDAVLGLEGAVRLLVGGDVATSVV